MTWKQTWPILGFLTLSTAIAGIVWWLSPWPFWACWLIVAAAVMVNGIIADWEDNRPGGFNNPKGDGQQ